MQSSRTTTCLGLTLVLVTLAACSRGAAPASSVESASDEPRSTFDVNGAGGDIVAADIPLGLMPEMSEVAVRATVLAVGLPFLNTTSGAWDPAPGLSDSELHMLFAELAPYTPVRLRIEEVLGERGDSSIRPSPGSELKVTLLGGSFDLMITSAQAKAIGITVPVEEGEGQPNQGTEDSQTVPPETVSVTINMKPAAYLAEGDAVIAFLRSDTIAVYPGERTSDVVVSLSPNGFGFFRTQDGSFQNATTRKSVSEEVLEVVAEEVSDQTGPLRRVTFGTY